MAVRIVVTAAAVVVGFTVFAPTRAGSAEQAASWFGVVVIVVLTVTCHAVDPGWLDRHGILLAIPAVGVLLVLGLGLRTADTSAAAQVFVALPTLWSSSQLRRTAAFLVTGLAVVGNTAAVLLLEPLAVAVADAVLVGTALVLLSVLLVRAGDRQEELVARLESLAAVDPLTGLVTRRVLDQAVISALTSASVAGGTALILVDVDDVKAVNDHHGHLAGDDALRHLAGVLSAAVRHTDAVVSRTGGDELAVLLTGCTSASSSIRARELHAAVRAAPLELAHGPWLALTVSIGVAHRAHSSGGLRELYSAADEALYRAKRGGRDQVVVAHGAG